MIVRIVKYIYHFGLIDFLRRCVNRAHQPVGVGFVWRLRHVVYGIGACYPVPTLRTCRLRKLLAGVDSILVVLTLPAGGGSESYWQRRVATECTGRNLAVVVRPANRIGLLRVSLIRDNLQIEEFFIVSLRALYPLKCKKCHLLINELVFWDRYVTNGRFTTHDYNLIINQIVSLKQNLHCTMSFLLHDYFCVCPRYALVGSDGMYCQSEYSCEKCRDCLRDFAYAPTTFAAGMDIYCWRTAMHELLIKSDEVRTFSKDSLQRITKIYPDVKCTLVPHEPLVNFQPLMLKQKAKLVIGVVGTMSHIKGMDVVVDLAKDIEARGVDARIVIFGEIDLAWRGVLPKNIFVSGKYQHSSLPDLLVKYGVGIVLFPSIWPETFSYVIQELMMMQVPVVCYNIGAPKDRVAMYEHGLVISDFSIEATWDAIKILARREKINVEA